MEGWGSRSIYTPGPTGWGCPWWVLILSTSSLNSLPRHWRKSPRKDRQLFAGGGQPDTHIEVGLLGRCTRHCSRCWGTAGNKREKVLPSWSIFSIGENKYWIISRVSKKHTERVPRWQGMWRKISTVEFWGGGRRGWLQSAKEGSGQASLKRWHSRNDPKEGRGKPTTWLSRWRTFQAEETASPKALSQECPWCVWGTAGPEKLSRGEGEMAGGEALRSRALVTLCCLRCRKQRTAESESSCADSELKRGQGSREGSRRPHNTPGGGGGGGRCCRHRPQVRCGTWEKRSPRVWPEQLEKRSCLFLNQGKLQKQHMWGQRWLGAWLWASYVCHVCWAPKWNFQQKAGCRSEVRRGPNWM